MPAEPVISVRGQATLEVEPEIAVVWVVVMARAAPAAATVGPTVEFDFDPATQTVSAQVEARYTMTAPHFGD